MAASRHLARASLVLGLYLLSTANLIHAQGNLLLTLSLFLFRSLSRDLAVSPCSQPMYGFIEHHSLTNSKLLLATK